MVYLIRYAHIRVKKLAQYYNSTFQNLKQYYTT
jgi:hypothetical protein